ncbi:MAG: cytochrome c3 family protein [Chitinispirillaceae bacterium]|nr:cytochrome c3 family protein [Chitinispirillaceae bacterium]
MRRLLFILTFFCVIVARTDEVAFAQEIQSNGLFLDALISDDTQTGDVAPSPQETAAATVEYQETAPAGADDATNRPEKSVYSSSPDFSVDEARVQETPDIPKFSHKDHIEDVGAECVQCHQTLFSELVRGYKIGPSMKEICSQCHNGTDAPAELLVGFSDEKKYVKPTMPLFSHTTHIQHTEECNTCHTDIYKPLKKIQKVPPMKLCMDCHDNRKANSSCTVCHEHPGKLKPRSHTARWVYRNGHGTDARYNRRECLECHTDRECNQCHRGQSSFSVHRPGYEFSHGMDARTRTSNCAYCHDTENSCVQCHTRKR